MEPSENGYRPDIQDRLLELRAAGISYNECALTLATEGYRTRSGRPYTAQGLQKRAKPFEGPQAIVFQGVDEEAQLELFLQLLHVGSRQEGKAGDIFRASLDVWNAAITANKGRWEAAKEAVETASRLRKVRSSKSSKSAEAAETAETTDA